MYYCTDFMRRAPWPVIRVNPQIASIAEQRFSRALTMKRGPPAYLRILTLGIIAP
jgi:hypothetical protein